MASLSSFDIRQVMTQSSALSMISARAVTNDKTWPDKALAEVQDGARGIGAEKIEQGYSKKGLCCGWQHSPF